MSQMRAAILALLVLFLLPAGANAAKPSGLPVALLDVSAPKNALRANGVTLKPTGKAVYRFKKLGFTISDVAVSGSASGTFVLKDGFKIVKGKRSVTVRGMLVSIKGRNVAVSARIGGKRRTVLTGRAPSTATVDGGRIALAVSRAKLSITKQAVRVIRATIKSYKPKRPSVGAFEGSAYVVAPPAGGGTIDPDRAKECLPLVPGATTDLPKPAGAVDVDCGFFTWAPRSSWISYLEVNSPIDPAQSLPPVHGAQHYCLVDQADNPDTYYFSLPITAGWWNSATGRGDLRLAGGIHFKYQSHGLDISVSDLDVRFDGASSEIWLTAVHSGAPAGERIKFATFNAGAPTLGGPFAPGAADSRFDSTFTDYVANQLFLQYGSDPRGGCFNAGINF